MTPKPNGETVCCLGCGRDTDNKSGYCSRCVWGHAPHVTEAGNRRGKNLNRDQASELTETERNAEAE